MFPFICRVQIEIADVYHHFSSAWIEKSSKMYNVKESRRKREENTTKGCSTFPRGMKTLDVKHSTRNGRQEF